MAILGKTTILVIDTIHLLQMMDTCGTLLSLRIHISATQSFLKAEIQSFHISTFLVQNTVYTQTKQILPKMLPFTE